MNRCIAKARPLSCALALVVFATTPTILAQTPSAPPAPSPPTNTPAQAPAPAGTAAAPSGAVSLADRLSGPAKEDYEAARLLFRDRDYAGALVKFQSAYTRSNEPRLLFNMAACEKQMRHYAKTTADLERYREEAGTSLSQGEHDEVDHLLDELRPFVGVLNVSANEAGASVYIDDELRGTTPLKAPLRVDIGQRHLRLSKDGFSPVTQTVMVTGTEDVAISSQLQKIVHVGHLILHAGPNDAIEIDSRPVGAGSYDGELPSGGHLIRVSADGRQTFQSEVLIQDAQTRSMDVTLPSTSRRVPTWAWVVGGAAIVAAGAAVGGYYLFKTRDVTGPDMVGTADPGTVSLAFGRSR